MFIGWFLCFLFPFFFLGVSSGRPSQGMIFNQDQLSLSSANGVETVVKPQQKICYRAGVETEILNLREWKERLVKLQIAVF